MEEEYGRMLVLEQGFGLKHPHQHPCYGLVLHQVLTEQNWRQCQLEVVEYGRMLVLEQGFGLKHLHQHRTGDLLYQVPTEQDWRH
jgi:hypothetical protein